MVLLSDDQFYFFVDLVVELVDTTGLSPVAYCGFSGSSPDEVTNSKFNRVWSHRPIVVKRQLAKNTYGRVTSTELVNRFYPSNFLTFSTFYS